MPPSYSRSPRIDLEHGAKRRKTLHARLPSEPSVLDRYPRGPHKIFTRPWLKFSSRRVRLALVLVSVCLAGLLRYSLLPYLSRVFPRRSVRLPTEVGSIQDDTGSFADTSPRYSNGRSFPPQQTVKTSPPKDARRYLTFLPHSGFNNQRIALENAMLLAYILNCTLLVPPVRLGEPLPYRPFDTLSTWNALASRPRPVGCVEFPTTDDCRSWDMFVQISWNQLVDFGPVRGGLGLDVVFLPGSQTPHQFLQQSGVSDESIAFLKDTELYQYLIRDSPRKLEHVATGIRYRDEWELNYLHRVLESYTAIHFGTLFGTGRLKIHNSTYNAARSMIRKGMAISHPGVLKTAAAIRKKITLDNSPYLAVHMRVTTRKFKYTAKETGRLIWWELIAWLGVTQEAGIELEQRFLHAHKMVGRAVPPDIPFKNSTRSLLFGNADLARSSNRTCLHMPQMPPPLNSYLNIPLFIASDASNPQKHSALALLYATFRCVFVLNDFRDELKLLDDFRDTSGFPMGKFLVPLVDAVVAAQAVHIVGTRNSTFSGFITGTLHPAYSKGQ